MVDRNKKQNVNADAKWSNNSVVLDLFHLTGRSFDRSMIIDQFTNICTCRCFWINSFMKC